MLACLKIEWILKKKKIEWRYLLKTYLSYRDLLTKVKFGESIEDLQTCRLLIKQYIPTGLFVDPYELASLRERNITEVLLLEGFFEREIIVGIL